jgi:hypothetical protein
VHPQVSWRQIVFVALSCLRLLLSLPFPPPRGPCPSSFPSIALLRSLSLPPYI